jgi:hypothetical protein
MALRLTSSLLKSASGQSLQQVININGAQSMVILMEFGELRAVKI